MQNITPLTSDRTDIDVIDGHALRVFSVKGESGLTQLLHDGEQRCVGIDITASGWITTTLPWNNIAGRMMFQLKMLGEKEATLPVILFL